MIFGVRKVTDRLHLRVVVFADEGGVVVIQLLGHHQVIFLLFGEAPVFRVHFGKFLEFVRVTDAYEEVRVLVN